MAGNRHGLLILAYITRMCGQGKKDKNKDLVDTWISSILGWVPRCRSSGRVTSCGNRVTCVQQFPIQELSRMKTYEGINRSRGPLINKPPGEIACGRPSSILRDRNWPFLSLEAFFPSHLSSRIGNAWNNFRSFPRNFVIYSFR